MRTPSIPYMGNKGAIAEYIVSFIKFRHPNAKYFYDVFGGGGAISTQALRQGFTVFYNEVQPRIANLMQFLKKLNGKGLPPEWYEWVTKERFYEVKKSSDQSAYAGMIQQCWSFGNKGATYLFGLDIVEQKRLLHEIVVNRSEQARVDLENKFGVSVTIPNEDKIYDRYAAVRTQIKTTGKRVD